MLRTHSLRMVALAVLLGGSANALADEDLVKRIDALPERATEYAAIADAVVESGSVDLAERLLLRVADVDVWTAAETGDLRTLKLLALGDLDRLGMVWPGNPKDTPLARAVKSEQVKAVEFLLEATTWTVPANWDSESNRRPDSERERRDQFRSLAKSLRYGPHRGNGDVIRALHAAGLPLDATSTDAGSLLYSAAGKPGTAKLVAWLLEQKVDPDERNYSRQTAMHDAAWHGRIENVRLLLKAGADPNLRATWGWTPLHAALWQEHDEIVALLVEQGAEVDVFAAAGLGDVAALEQLWEKPFPEKFDGSIALVPLAFAARRGRVEAVRWLLAEDRTPPQPPKFGPVYHAASGGHRKVLTMLVEAEYALDELGSSQYYDDEGTPLEIAARNGHAELVKFLIERGAKVEGVPRGLKRSNDFDGPVGPMLAAIEKGHRDVVEALIDAGARLDPTPEEIAARNKFQRHVAPLQKAAYEGHLELCRLLLDRGANVHGPDEWSSPLHSAAAQGHLEVCRLLVDRGADLKRGANPPSIVVAKVRGKEYRSGKGAGTPLHVAAMHGHADVVEFLLKAGCDPNAIGSDDLCTPLASVVDELRGRENWTQRVEIVRMLVTAGGRLVESDYSQQLAYLGDPQLIATLEKRGATFERTQSPGAKYPSSLMVAAISVGGKDVVRWLLAEGVDVEIPLERRQKGYGVTLLGDCGHWGAKLPALVLLDSGLAPTPRDASMAAERGYLGTLGALIDEGAPGAAALDSAASQGRVDIVKYLVKRGVQLGDPDTGGVALRTAAARGEVAMVDLLLDAGVDPDARTGNQFPLLSAVQGSSDNTRTVVERLAEAGADLEMASTDGWTATRLTVSRGNISLAKRLIELGAELDPATAAALGRTEELAKFIRDDPTRFAQTKEHPRTPLEWAAREEGEPSVKMLLARLPEVYPPESEPCRRTLTIAAGRGRLEIVRMLLDHGASPDGAANFAPIVAAAREKHFDIVRLLMERGADVNHGLAGNDLALHHAIRANDEKLVEQLLEAGADPSIAGGSGNSPLHVAAVDARVKLVDRLLEADATVAALNKKGQTPLDVADSEWPHKDEHLAAHAATVRRLIRGGADVTAGTGSAVHQATRAKHLELVKELIALGAPVDSPDDYGRTALMTAVERYGNGGNSRRGDVLAIIKLLLDHGASTTVEDQRGRSVQFYLDYLRLDELRKRFPKLAKP